MDTLQHDIDPAQQPQPAPHGRRGRRAITAALLAGAVVVGATGGLIAGHASGSTTTAATGTTAAGTLTGPYGGGSSGGGTTGGGTLGGGTSGSGTFGGGANGSTGSGTAVAATRSATSAEETGVVDITTVLDFGTGEAAGTGIVLTSSGEILTNNHVVDGATTITATDVATGRSYTATVVGTDATDDVAVLQLTGASGLVTAPLASASEVAALAAGDAVTAVGNAGGTGGTPTAADGTVSALDQAITASDETGSSAEQLSGLIEVAAAIQPGDSGGPLLDAGEVVGIDTAADGQGTTGYAIPITTATAIADRIVAGEQSATITQGTPAFLGVQLSGTDGATVAGVIAGSPAATAGLGAGDTVTAVDGSAVGGGTSLSSLVGAHKPGDRVRLNWTDADGTAHTATVTLIAGPAV